MEPRAALFQSVDPAGSRLTGRALSAAGRPGDEQAACRGRRAAAFDELPHVPGDGGSRRTCRTGEPREHAQQILGAGIDT